METGRQKNKTYHQENPPGGVTHKKQRTNADYGMLMTFKK